MHPLLRRPLPVAFCLALILTLFLWIANHAQSSRPLAALSAFASPVALGEPCDVQSSTEADSPGFQCYWYGEPSDRQAVWIKPDIRPPQPSAFDGFIADWNNFSSADRKIFFKYPSSWRVEDDEWRETGVLQAGPRVGSSIDPLLTVQLLELERGDAGIADAIADIEKKYAHMEKHTVRTINTEAIRIDAAPFSSLEFPQAAVFIPFQGRYYLAVSFPKTGNPLDDFIMEAIAYNARFLL